MGNNFTPAWIKKGFFNESLFCDDFLSTHQLLYVNGAFFTPEGRVTDTMNLRCEIFGKILLNYAKDKRNKLYLNVYQKNARAISFYKREGFEIHKSVPLKTVLPSSSLNSSIAVLPSTAIALPHITISCTAANRNH